MPERSDVSSIALQAAAVVESATNDPENSFVKQFREAAQKPRAEIRIHLHTDLRRAEEIFRRKGDTATAKHLQMLGAALDSLPSS